MSPSYPSSSAGGSRAVWLAIAALVVAFPAALLVALCPGDICGRAEEPETRVPFCSLPSSLRRSLVAGYREGRSPDVFIVTGREQIRGSDIRRDRQGPLWPSAGDPPAAMGLGFWGTGVNPRAEIEEGSLDDIAPTIARISGLDRAHPEVRSGEAIPSLVSGQRPRLVVLIVWKDVSGADLEDAADMTTVSRASSEGAFTTRATPGSAPSDPGALLATVGTGGLPFQHGTTGSLLRAESGRVVEAWGAGAPLSIIATLGDDLDELTDQRARIGLVGTRRSDVGLVGGNWYVTHDRDDVHLLGARTDPGMVAETARSLLEDGYGGDDVTDLLAIALEGEDLGALDRATTGIVEAAERASGDSSATVLVTIGTDPGADALASSEISTGLERSLGTDVVAAEAVGGLFLDQEALVGAKISEDDVAVALRAMKELRGGDVFDSTAIELARYC